MPQASFVGVSAFPVDSEGSGVHAYLAAAKRGPKPVEDPQGLRLDRDATPPASVGSGMLFRVQREVPVVIDAR